ncbi:MAG: hypothetical protein AB7E29_05855 [Xanthobacter sp.]
MLHQPPANPDTIHASTEVEPTPWQGDATTIIDTKNFPVTNMSALIIDLEPGALREIH